MGYPSQNDRRREDRRREGAFLAKNALPQQDKDALSIRAWHVGKNVKKTKYNRLGSSI